jgi:hypothetical protein
MPSTPSSPHSDILKAALDERRPILLAMREDEIERQPKVDASVAAEAVIGQAPQIAAQRDAMIAQFGAAAGALVDELLVVARATKQADVELSLASASKDLSPMEEALAAEHTLLFTDAQALANRKLLDPARLEATRSTLGYRTLIHNTLVLVGLMREQWATIADHTPTTEADLERTATKANAMLTALGERDQGSTRVPALEVRIRALSALVRHYDKIRRMVSFLRWEEGDADEIAPSLYVRKASRRQQDDATDATPTDHPAITPATPSNGAPPSSPFVT